MMSSIPSSLKHYLNLISPYLVLYLVLQNLMRVCFILLEFHELDIAWFEWLSVFARGLAVDLVTFMYIFFPVMLYITFIRPLLSNTLAKISNVTIFAATAFILLFNAAAEYLFWDEFRVRFNFIAVDYLIYTHEVITNIYQSYPVVLIISALALLTITLTWICFKYLFLRNNSPAPNFRNRAAIFAVYTLILTASLGLNFKSISFSSNEHANEITKNGIYSLFSAFRNNDLSYSKFYLKSFDNHAVPALKELISKQSIDPRFLNNADPNDITRLISSGKVEKRSNIIIVVMESMSAEYMAKFGNPDNLTPNLDALSSKSLFFTNLYATGTRTVRGLEAITLSIPPTPGNSVLKRPNNEGLYSLGYVFKDRGYDVKFLYGGYGYFDNMNYFFSTNGFGTIDRLNFSESEQTFSNAWGLCDEDLFNKSISQANESFKNGEPFMQLIMTTSNHRPYTFPTGKIDLPADGSGKRPAGVKYADFAIGQFIKNAAKNPWFDDTIFVFVADHTAGSAGKSELTVAKYHIPLIIYAPKLIKHDTISDLASQIDLAPTLLGLLDFNYISRFYGKDFKNYNRDFQYAFISNYQKLGYLTPNYLTVLKPGKIFTQYGGSTGLAIAKGDINAQSVSEAISFYSNSELWRVRSSRVETVSH